MLSVETQQRVEKLLLQSGLITGEKLAEVRQEALQQNVPLLQMIADRKLVDEEELVKVQAQASEVLYVNLRGVQVKDEIIKLLPKSVAETYQAVPFGQMQSKLAVAMLDPSNVQAVDFIARKTGKVVAVFMASPASIQRVLSQYKADLASDVGAALKTVGSEPEPVSPKKSEAKARDLQTLVQDAPITRALNAILDSAVQVRASDIHIEPRESDLKIRYRIDGILQETMTLPKSVEPALISRIKILSNLKIDEHRVPQDGQFQIKSNNQEVDLRVAIAPITWGEQVVIRLLNKSSSLLTLDSLGFKGRAFRVITEGIHRPHGMTLSTGPTGSGKSTTLYAVIQALNDASINIVTLEDPVEYKMSGINQMQVNVDVGLTFASGLRSILRQDPNVVMVGEIRDKETADLAIQAALTGHVVLSTIHTNSAAGVLPRFLDMGVEPFLIASTINTVIGQRLVRRLCEKCRIEKKTSLTVAQSISKVLAGVLPKTKNDLKANAEDLGYDDLPLAGQNAYTLYEAKSEGCRECSKGYKGRVGIYEVFAMTPDMEKLLALHATTTQVQDQAQKDGMLTMKQDGYLKVLTGLTTIEEVARVAADY
jgi:type IV pilus assembly protein PilB